MKDDSQISAPKGFGPDLNAFDWEDALRLEDQAVWVQITLPTV